MLHFVYGEQTKKQKLSDSIALSAFKGEIVSNSLADLSVITFESKD